MSFVEFADVFRSSFERAMEGRKPDAAWLGDPTDRHESRYWDGERWTAWVANGGVRGSDPVDLGQDGATWQERFENDTIAALRRTVLTDRFGVTPLELQAVGDVEPVAAHLLHGQPIGTVDVAKVEQAIGLLRTPLEQVAGTRDRLTKKALDVYFARARMDAGVAVAMVHCAKCHAVRELTFDAKGNCFRCPERHVFVIGQIRVVPTAEVDRARAELATSPPCKGGRPLF